MIEQHRIIQAFHRKVVDRTPIWMMRQAGRYLPEYRALREKAQSFMALCKNPEWAMEVTLQPLARFDLDAAILFSDILTIPDAMGLGLYFEEGKGPIFEKPLSSHQDIKNLSTAVCQDLQYVFDAANLTFKALAGKVPLLGFAGSPFTVATYMIEGRSSKTFSLVKKMMYQEPELLHLLLDKLTKVTIEYAKGQIDSGASAFMLFDTWASHLDNSSHIQFSIEYLKQIVQALKRDPKYQSIPIILFSKNSGRNLQALAATGCQGLGLDWTASLKEARALVGDQVALQGNLDPAVLYASPEVIEDKVSEVLSAFGYGPGHIFNLGHGIHPDTPIESVETLIAAVKKLSPAYHQSPQSVAL